MRADQPMSDIKADALLSAVCELWIERHREHLGIRPGAVGDLAGRMLALGVLARGDDGSLRSVAGGTPADLVSMIRGDAPHLFRGPSEDHTIARKPNARALGPSARLALANGHEPMRPA